MWYFFPDGIHFRRQPEHHHCLSFAETNSPQIRACFHLELLFQQLLLWLLPSCLGPCFAPPPFPCSSSLSLSLRVSELEKSLSPCRNPANPIPAGWRCSLCLHTSHDRELNPHSGLPDLNPMLTACSIYSLLMV